jgi:DNA-binding protein H-NS
MSTFHELLAQRAALEAEIEAAKAEERLIALEEVKRLVDEFAFSTREVFGTSAVRKRQPVQPRYRDPATGATERPRPVTSVDRRERPLAVSDRAANRPGVNWTPALDTFDLPHSRPGWSIRLAAYQPMLSPWDCSRCPKNLNLILKSIPCCSITRSNAQPKTSAES